MLHPLADAKGSQRKEGIPKHKHRIGCDFGLCPNHQTKLVANPWLAKFGVVLVLAQTKHSYSISYILSLYSLLLQYICQKGRKIHPWTWGWSAISAAYRQQHWADQNHEASARKNHQCFRTHRLVLRKVLVRLTMMTTALASSLINIMQLGRHLGEFIGMESIDVRCGNVMPLPCNHGVLLYLYPYSSL